MSSLIFIRDAGLPIHFLPSSFLCQAHHSHITAKTLECTKPLSQSRQECWMQPSFLHLNIYQINKHTILKHNLNTSIYPIAMIWAVFSVSGPKLWIFLVSVEFIHFKLQVFCNQWPSYTQQTAQDTHQLQFCYLQG